MDVEYAKAKTVDPNRAIRVARASLYPIEIWWLIVSTISLLALIHWSSVFISFLRRRSRRAPVLSTPTDAEKVVDVRRPASSATRLANAIVNTFRITFFRATIPLSEGYAINAVEALFAVAYIAALFTWEFIGTRNVVTHANFDIQYWSNRAGTIAASQVPFIVALGSKNNLIGALTGIGYEYLSYLHRTAARTVLILIYVHFIGRVKLGLMGDISIEEAWIRAGILAVVAFTLLLLLSLRPVRKHSYELFYFSHILLVLIILLGVYFHTLHAPPGFSRFIWPAFILWGLDRLFRLARVLFTYGGSHNARAVRVSAEVTRVDITVPPYLSWKPGQHAFITFPGISKMKTEAHPFTISNTRDGSGKLTFFIKSKRGMTRKLFESTVIPKSIRVVVDGPYGTPPPFLGKECLILIGGGTGCSYVFPLLEAALRAQRDKSYTPSRIVFIWSVKEQACIDWITGSLKQLLLNSSSSELPPISLRLEIYVTGQLVANGIAKESESGSMSSNELAKEEKSLSETEDGEMGSLKDCRDLQIFRGRPSLPKILREEIFDGNFRNVAVHVSGPNELSNSVRSSLTSFSGISAVDVSLHVEHYGFA